VKLESVIKAFYTALKQYTDEYIAYSDTAECITGQQQSRDNYQGGLFVSGAILLRQSSVDSQ